MEGPITRADLDLISGYVGWQFREKVITKRGKQYHILAAFSPGRCIHLVSMQKLATMTFADFLRLLHAQDGIESGRWHLCSAAKRCFPDPRAYEP